MVFVQILLPVFLIIGAGAALARWGRVEMQPLTQFALFLAVPALVFSALLRNPVEPAAVARLVGFMALHLGAMWALATAVSRALGLAPELARAFALVTVPMNIGNYGLPLVRFAFGPESEAFSVLVFVAFNLPLSTWAIWMAARGRAEAGGAVREVLRIPIFHATVLAFAFVALGWRLPGAADKAVHLMGQAAIPVMLVLLGMQLARTRVRDGRGSLAAAAILRLGVSPLLAWGLCALVGFDGLERKVAVLQTSTPSAVLPLLYALRFGIRPDWIASAILVTTLLSGLSLTAVLWFLV